MEYRTRGWSSVRVYLLVSYSVVAATWHSFMLVNFDWPLFVARMWSRNDYDRVDAQKILRVYDEQTDKIQS